MKCAGTHRSCNRVRRVMKAVYKVKDKRKDYNRENQILQLKHIL